MSLYRITLTIPGPLGAEQRATSTRTYAEAVEWIDRQLIGTRMLALSVVRRADETRAA